MEPKFGTFVYSPEDEFLWAKKMLTNLNFGSKCTAAALFCGIGLALGGITLVSAEPQTEAVQVVAFTEDAAIADADVEVRMAVEGFIGGMARGDAHAVWAFASEEDQQAFQTEQAVLAAFSEVFPALTGVSSVHVDTITQQGETPFVKLALTGKDGESYRATIGFWLDDAGDWKVISCDVKPALDQVAGL